MILYASKPQPDQGSFPIHALAFRFKRHKPHDRAAESALRYSSGPMLLKPSRATQSAARLDSINLELPHGDDEVERARQMDAASLSIREIVRASKGRDSRLLKECTMTSIKHDLASLDEADVQPPKGHEAAASLAKPDQRSLLDMMEGMPSSDGIDFDLPCVVIKLQDINFDAED